MDAVQRMRAMAYDRNKLVTTKEQVVTRKEEQNRQVISIEPAVPDTLYVPYYEPQVSAAIGHTPTIRPIRITGVILATSPPA